MWTTHATMSYHTTTATHTVMFIGKCSIFWLGKLNTLSGFHYSKKVFDTLAMSLVKKKYSAPGSTNIMVLLFTKCFPSPSF